MILQILGCGTSTGVPIPGCNCDVCTSSNPKNKRSRTSALLRLPNGKNVLLDASTDLRQQALQWNVKRVDAVLYTHAHADHILGTDDLRCFNFVSGSPIPCFGTAETLAALRKTFDYIFEPDPSWEGGMLAQLKLHEIRHYETFELFGVQITPFLLHHGKRQVTGYKFGKAAYATDTNSIPERSIALLGDLDLLVLDALRKEKHSTHFSIDQACRMAAELKAKQTYFVHMTHSVDFESDSKLLPSGVCFAYDGLQIEI